MLTSEQKTAIINELCYGDLYGGENCRKHFSYIGRIIDRDKTLAVGDFILSDEQLSDLYDIVSGIYSTGTGRHTTLTVALTTLAIVNICRDYDLQGEDNLYVFIQKKLFGNSPWATKWLPRTKICEAMDRFFGRVSKHVLFGTLSRRSYYSTILFHSFAPKSSFFAFLDVLWFIHNGREDDAYFEEDYSGIADKIAEK
ncbi:MAG: hypothetical protein FWG01_00530, partial [Betaproteobacteria bacterium]|nr:hypothetical protein [Betaproteobacteria bacterium]